jgi:prepilin-type N-terminal cleavage/methylation domain-containing protein/prepilin-type processing-associated H-X9-DG protein
MSYRRPSCHVARGGFTLVELLVVIGIIALLISILMPALSRAKTSARTTQCLSNIRQLTIAYQMYTNNNKGKFMGYSTAVVPMSNPPQNGFWMHELKPFNGDISVVGICPEATEPNNPPVFGNVSRAWGPEPKDRNSFLFQVTGSYAMNGWCYGPNVDAGPFKGKMGGTQYVGGTADTWHVFPVSEASNVPIFSDSSWVDTWPLDTDPPGDLIHGDQQMMTRVCLKRHAKRFVNVSFMDGHAESVELPNLWKLKWSRKFNTTKQPPQMPANYGK